MLRRPKFEMRQVEAAESLGISVTTLQHACRRLGIPRWPWRNYHNTSKTVKAASRAGLDQSDSTQSGRLLNTAENFPGKFPRKESAGSDPSHPTPMCGGCAFPYHSTSVAEPASNIGSGSCFDPGEMDVADQVFAPLSCRGTAEIWRMCNINNNGLLDEALTSVDLD